MTDKLPSSSETLALAFFSPTLLFLASSPIDECDVNLQRMLPTAFLQPTRHGQYGDDGSVEMWISIKSSNLRWRGSANGNLGNKSAQNSNSVAFGNKLTSVASNIAEWQVARFCSFQLAFGSVSLLWRTDSLTSNITTVPSVHLSLTWQSRERPIWLYRNRNRWSLSSFLNPTILVVSDNPSG